MYARITATLTTPLSSGGRPCRRRRGSRGGREQGGWQRREDRAGGPAAQSECGALALARRGRAQAHLAAPEEPRLPRQARRYHRVPQCQKALQLNSHGHQIHALGSGHLHQVLQLRNRGINSSLISHVHCSRMSARVFKENATSRWVLIQIAGLAPICFCGRAQHAESTSHSMRGTPLVWQQAARRAALQHQLVQAVQRGWGSLGRCSKTCSVLVCRMRRRPPLLVCRPYNTGQLGQRRDVQREGEHVKGRESKPKLNRKRQLQIEVEEQELKKSDPAA